MNFAIHVSDRIDETVQVVRIAGELDHDSVRAAERRFSALVAKAPPYVVLDLADLAFLSSDGIRVLLEARRSLEAAGAVVSVVGMRPSVQRVFAVMQTLPASRFFPTTEELDEYLAALQPVRRPSHLGRARRALEVGEGAAGVAGRVHVVRISGEIDSSNEREAAARIESVLADPRPWVILDLAALTFLGSVGVRVLRDTHRSLAEQGATVLGAGLRPAVRRVLDIVEVPIASRWFEDVAAALAHVVASEHPDPDA